MRFCQHYRSRNIFALVILLLISFEVVFTSNPKSVCIVGAGFSGGTAAYFVKKYMGDSVSIKIYEKSSRVGGRVNDVLIGDHRVELGGTVIHEANLLMKGFAEEFGLTKHSTEREDSTMGIWNGKEMVYQQSKNYIISVVKALWRYGLSPVKLKQITSDLTVKWLHQYNISEPWPDVPTYLTKYGLKEFVDSTMTQYYLDQGLNLNFLNEIVAGITQVIYQQPPSQITAIGGSIAFVGTGSNLFVIEEGNKQVIVNQVKYAKAKLEFETEVKEIEKLPSNKFKVVTNKGEEEFDAVIIATPLELTSITLTGIPNPLNKETTRKYVHVFSSYVRGQVDPHAFGVTDPSDLPHTILRAEGPGGAIPDWSQISRGHEFGDGTRLYKMFTPVKPTEQFLSDKFLNITSVTTAEWYAYPYFYPSNKFSPVVLTPGVYYPSAFDSVMSVIECSAISARNSARLLATHFGAYKGEVESTTNNNNNNNNKEEKKEDL